MAYKSANPDQSVVGFDGLRHLTQEKLLTSPCDILVPAAKETQILAGIAKDVEADVVLELANGPTTNLAHEILVDKKVFVLPDILANAGGVSVSYFEWLQNKAGESWELSQVKEKLQRRMANAYNSVVETAKNYNLDMRSGAFVFAISKAIDVVYERGIFP
jgi:glutamate dehydrogenase/leucine dehydrogenase